MSFSCGHGGRGGGGVGGVEFEVVERLVDVVDVVVDSIVDSHGRGESLGLGRDQRSRAASFRHVFIALVSPAHLVSRRHVFRSWAMSDMCS